MISTSPSQYLATFGQLTIEISGKISVNLSNMSSLLFGLIGVVETLVVSLRQSLRLDIRGAIGQTATLRLFVF